jgi:cytochrome c oxidase subunit 3|tara:strand:+ start:1304 stop:2194 length:891 start_codon:yes stop_codon:yes gene_type:complete
VSALGAECQGFKSLFPVKFILQITLSKMNSNLLQNNQRHPYHLVDPSPWPLSGALGGFALTFGGVMFMHGYSGGWSLFCLGFLTILYTMYVWWRDIVREGTFEGQHTYMVQQGLRQGVLLFIVSEIMFFFAFFWAFFDASIKPAIVLGGVWPPDGLEILNPWGVPLLNTVILLTSGATVTWAHHGIVAGAKKSSQIGLFLTIILAAIFTGLQVLEYLESPFTISDGVYGSTFFMATGFHGFHVFIGTCFLTVCLLRLNLNHFTREHHFGFEAAAWYWHFVDVVWLFLFVTVYWWGS